MGIRHLNRFLKMNCKNAIYSIHLSQLCGKSIVIDTSIYLYKYAENDCIIQNMKNMIETFKKYNINPIFIFDGKPPKEKDECIALRKKERINSYNKYKETQLIYDKAVDDNEKKILEECLERLKKKIVCVKKDDIKELKRLMILWGIRFINAIGEADLLSAQMVINKEAWGCLSEDMDLFVYGCPFVFRELDLINHTVVCYNTKLMLRILNMTQNEFREVCVLSGTDYSNTNIDNKEPDIDNKEPDNDLYHHKKSLKLFQIMKYFKKFKRELFYNNERNTEDNTKTTESVNNESNKQITFYEWLSKNTTFYFDFYEINRINKLFCL